MSRLVFRLLWWLKRAPQVLAWSASAEDGGTVPAPVNKPHEKVKNEPKPKAAPGNPRRLKALGSGWAFSIRACLLRLHQRMGDLGRGLLWGAALRGWRSPSRARKPALAAPCTPWVGAVPKGFRIGMSWKEM